MGQDGLLERMLVALLARGHLLVEGVPGLAKTMAVKTLAQVIGGRFQRIQFTSDLVPADVVGTRIYNQRAGEFQVSLGPVFTNLLLADEINRAPAKVQGALLEVMQERQVTIGRDTFPAPDPFLVMATQNPIESEGTYPLPEAQLDRFMFKVLVGYPTATQEFVVVERMTTTHESPEPVVDVETLLGYQRGADAVYVDPQIIEYAVRLSTATRDPAAVGSPDLARYVTFGASPRASINMVLGAKALAFLRGRDYALPADVRELARDVLRHRVVLSYEALADDVSPDDVLGPLLAAIPLPELDQAELDHTGLDQARARPSRARRLRAPVVTELAALTPERVLRRLEWRVLRRLDGRLQGDYRTVFRGTGVDVADLREYQFGDDLRHVDWNVTARTDIAHVREYTEDREVTAWLLLDLSASMDFGPVQRHKHVVLTEVAATVAQLLSRGGNRVGALLFDAGVRETIPPASGRNQVLRILSRLLRPAAPAPGTTDLGAALRAALGILRRRSLVVIISDFLSEPGWQGLLGQLARRHDVVAIQVVDRREFDLPAAGMIYVEDAETGEVIFVDTDDPGFRQRLAAAADERQAALVADLASAGLDLHPVATDDDLVRALFRLAHLRRRARSGVPRC